MTKPIRAKEYREQTRPSRKSKYNNKAIVIQGHRFDSKKEGDRFLFLKARLDAGEISHLELHPVFKLTGRDGKPVRYDSGRQAFYKADFAYFEPDLNKRVIEDVKSKATKTPVYKLKKALVQCNFPGVVIVEV